MKTSKPRIAGILGVVTIAASAAMVYSQEHGGHHPQQQGTPSMAEAIFCPAKSTGQLCNHGTADVLKLGGAKREQWTEAANRYNKAVEAATKQLLEDAKATLSPGELAQVEKWFAKGLNPEINRLLGMKDVPGK